jgi:hypothetical protein
MFYRYYNVNNHTRSNLRPRGICNPTNITVCTVYYDAESTVRTSNNAKLYADVTEVLNLCAG